MGRGRRNRPDDRGNCYARRVRKLWLLSPESGWGGDSETVPCWECGVLLEYEDLFEDRLIRGEDGGRYIKANVAPHCPLCSHRQGQRRTIEILRKKVLSAVS